MLKLGQFIVLKTNEEEDMVLLSSVKRDMPRREIHVLHWLLVQEVILLMPILSLVMIKD